MSCLGTSRPFPLHTMSYASPSFFPPASVNVRPNCATLLLPSSLLALFQRRADTPMGLTPLTVAQVLKATRVPPEDDFRVDGFRVGQVC